MASTTIHVLNQWPPVWKNHVEKRVECMYENNHTFSARTLSTFAPPRIVSNGTNAIKSSIMTLFSAIAGICRFLRTRGNFPGLMRAIYDGIPKRVRR